MACETSVSTTFTGVSFPSPSTARGKAGPGGVLRRLENHAERHSRLPDYPAAGDFNFNEQETSKSPGSLFGEHRWELVLSLLIGLFVICLAMV